MPFLEIDGAPFHYQVEGGEGPVLVLSNSLGTDLRLWDPQVPKLARRFHVLRYDTRGHGASAVTPGPYSLDRLGGDLVALLDALGVQRAHFCGISLGGMTGMWLATHQRDRVDRLALCNTAAFMPPVETWNARIAAVERDGMGAVVEGVLARWFTEEFRRAQPATIERVRQMLLATDPAGYAGCCAAIRDMDQREGIASIDARTLVIAGARDPATTPEQGRFLAATIPGARYRELDAAHLSNIEQAAAFTDAVLEFMEG
jgi:3-oxoadipate enol-lactonase